jgi:hypothetical protein
MDWRLIAAVAAAACSLGVVAVGARAVLTASAPPPPQKIASVPALTAADRARAAAAPSLTPPPSPQLSPPPAFPAGAPSGQTARSPFAAPEDSVFSPGPPGAYAPLAIPPLVADQSLRQRPEPRAGGYKTAALRPREDVSEPPARPIIETKKPSVVPELQTALPAPHYRGVLTTAEISRIRHNLRLTPEQEPAWPRVEAALAEMGRQQIALIRQGLEPRIPPNDWPPGRLYAVAGPLLQTLRPDQKETVRKVCRSLGFESVASML